MHKKDLNICTYISQGNVSEIWKTLSTGDCTLHGFVRGLQSPGTSAGLKTQRSFECQSIQKYERMKQSSFFTSASEVSRHRNVPCGPMLDILEAFEAWRLEEMHCLATTIECQHLEILHLKTLHRHKASYI